MMDEMTDMDWLIARSYLVCGFVRIRVGTGFVLVVLVELGFQHCSGSQKEGA